MLIHDMFRDDINRRINGVIKVDQNDSDITEQEVCEYVITNELKKHFLDFFQFYAQSFDEPTDDIGIWISGFFGSGKSHFLKILSYILENRDIHDVKTVERFREKFEDAPTVFRLIDKATRTKAETILFNIDVESSIQKDETAILRVLAKVFYKHLGFYGEDLKVAMLEKYIEQCGKTEEFRRIFKINHNASWIEQRKNYIFCKRALIQSLSDVFDMSEDDAKTWIEDKNSVNFSIAQLVDDIKYYINTKPSDFRLIFMIDEVGQYIGNNTSLLLNLQSVVEKLGTECQGKVWIICTGQESMDAFMKTKTDEFSRIQARFKTRLSLTSSSLDEVIQKRLLQKKDNACKRLSSLYKANESALRNLFSFTNSASEIRGYSNAQEFSRTFPFVPYQFIIMQKAFAEIRSHGNTGKNFSGAERSMLSGFQEAAQMLCQTDEDETALAPFYLFYDTIHTFLSESIRQVIERCQCDADSDNGIEPYDVNILKLLFLIRYIRDIPSSMNNIAILMANNIRTDIVILKKKIRKSLERLLNKNYIELSNNCYKFLTEEEQHIQKEINNTSIDSNDIIKRIYNHIFGSIYTSKKYRHSRLYNFDFNKRVDEIGNTTHGIGIQFLTSAVDKAEKADIKLLIASRKQAIATLDETSGYECYIAIEHAMKIRKYIKQRNIAQLPDSIQDIIKSQSETASRHDESAVILLEKAIVNARFFVDGEQLTFKPDIDAKSRIDQALEFLVTRVYSELGLITKNIEKDSNIRDILNGRAPLDSQTYNADAVSRITEYLDLQWMKKQTMTMLDIQLRYQNIPYGWRDIDIAGVVAQLIHDQKVTIQYEGTPVQPDDPKLIEMLRKSSETGKTFIDKKQTVTTLNIKQTKEFLREYIDVMDVPDDEDELVKFIIRHLKAQQLHCNELLSHYSKNTYPDEELVRKFASLATDILSHSGDNIMLISAILKASDDLLDLGSDMKNVEGFFKTQKQTFDNAIQLLADMANDMDYLSKDEKIQDALNNIQAIMTPQKRFNYKRIPELNALMKTVKEGHQHLIELKRNEIDSILEQIPVEIQQLASSDSSKAIIEQADDYISKRRQHIQKLHGLALLDAQLVQIFSKLDEFKAQIEGQSVPKASKSAKSSVRKKKTDVPSAQPDQISHRQLLFSKTRLETEDDVENYLKQIREKLLARIKSGTLEIL